MNHTHQLKHPYQTNMNTFDKFMRLEELLRQRDILTEISAELYGEMFVENENFWGSVTEKQMASVVEEIIELGYIEHFSDEVRNHADKIFRRFFGDLPDEDLDM